MSQSKVPQVRDCMSGTEYPDVVISPGFSAPGVEMSPEAPGVLMSPEAPGVLMSPEAPGVLMSPPAASAGTVNATIKANAKQSRRKFFISISSLLSLSQCAKAAKTMTELSNCQC